MLLILTFVYFDSMCLRYFSLDTSLVLARCDHFSNGLIFLFTWDQLKKHRGVPFAILFHLFTTSYEHF